MCSGIMYFLQESASSKECRSEWIEAKRGIYGDPDTADEMKIAFASVDQTKDGILDPEEWAEPLRLVLPNGRPPEKFEALDANGDGLVSLTEYQEPDLLVDAIETWQETDGDMREVLRTILLSDEFLSLRHYRSKVKTPLEVTISAARILDASFPMDQLLQTANDITLAGMELFDFSDPTGESEFAFDWMHTVGLLERLKFIHRGVFPASNGQRRFIWFPNRFSRRFDLSTAERTVDFFDLLIHGGAILQNQRELAIEAYTSASFFNRQRAAMAFIMSLPQFQKQ